MDFGSLLLVVFVDTCCKCLEDLDYSEIGVKFDGQLPLFSDSLLIFQSQHIVGDVHRSTGVNHLWNYH